MVGTEVFRIYPIEGTYIPGRRAVEQDVTEAEWLVINEYQPPAFVCDPLEGVPESPEGGNE
jgi:hypothetical protein